jgi:uncharacterized damage-inducible protein DinB
VHEIALESFRHNSWATRRLLTFCRPLDAGQRAARGVGTFGTLVETLDHVVRCDGAYARRVAAVVGLADAWLGWVDEPASAEGDPLDELDGWAAEAGTVWERVLAGPVDVEQVLPVDDDARQCRLGVLFAQAVNHANHHREQVCAILTGLGLEPPDIQAWEHAWATGRIWDTPG